MIKHAVLDVVETSNLILREIRASDAGDLSCFMTQARYQKHIVHRLKDETEVKDFVRRQIAHQGDSRRRLFHLSAEERMSAEVIGDGFLIHHPDQSVEIGWGLHPALWSMGFGTEIGRALLAIGIERLKAKRVWCKIMRPNTASVVQPMGAGSKLASICSRAAWSGPTNGGASGAASSMVVSWLPIPMAGGRWVLRTMLQSKACMARTLST